MHSDVKASSPESTGLAIKPGTVEQCHVVIDLLAQQVAALQEQVSLLSERVKLSSRNSSKPPSSDGPASGSNRATRRASQRKRGAQSGHPGSFRALLDESKVSAVQEIHPATACDCGGTVVVRGKPVRHQVFDLPATIQPDVQEYRLYTGVCSHCRKAREAALPPGVPRSQIGPRALAFIGVLGTHYHLTQFKIRDLLARMMGVNFSVGAISEAHGKVAAALKAPAAQAAASLSAAAVLHVDETRYPREGTTNWVWAAVQPKLAVFQLLPSRARYVLQELIGAKPQSIIVSDRYTAYGYIDSHQRQVCWAHLLRDFTRIAERSGAAGRVGRRLLALGHVLFRWHKAGKNAEQFEPIKRRLQQALQRGIDQAGCKRTANTCANVLKLWPALWTFVHQPGVAPTNNAAEQAIRSIVLKRKISGPTRSRRGDEFIAHGYTAMESCRRQGRDLMDYVHAAVVAMFSGTAYPSLLPSAAPNG